MPGEPQRTEIQPPGPEPEWSAVEARSPRGAAFLLAQVGAYAAQRFAERVGELGVSPSDVGLLRLVARRPGLSQRELAGELGVVPSRVVTLIDQLDRGGLVERRRSARDRRHHELHLSPAGEELLARMHEVAADHEDALLTGLDTEERTALRELLGRIAREQDLAPGVHPGYRQGGVRR
ncbi:MarR family winged helix-turn-helix transcriptional regulator [Streptomyces sp. NPDC049954]|uniref:MarR family winged helix-turn-helix transcriptional regulator n=1 Tax=Streptomyces sp. NPDC049954 TaxID=3155779 RepID=UPI00343BC20C